MTTDVAPGAAGACRHPLTIAARTITKIKTAGLSMEINLDWKQDNLFTFVTQVNSG